MRHKSNGNNGDASTPGERVTLETINISMKLKGEKIPKPWEDPVGLRFRIFTSNL
jgi:hypothetical protein